MQARVHSGRDIFVRICVCTLLDRIVVIFVESGCLSPRIIYWVVGKRVVVVLFNWRSVQGREPLGSFDTISDVSVSSFLAEPSAALRALNSGKVFHSCLDIAVSPLLF